MFVLFCLVLDRKENLGYEMKCGRPRVEVVCGHIFLVTNKQSMVSYSGEMFCYF